MKKIFLIFTLAILFCPQAFAQNTDNIALLTQKGFFNKPKQEKINPCDEVKQIMAKHLKYANNYDLKGLKSLYADSYINSDGFNKNIYFDLVKKTWNSYPDIKYKMNVKNIEINGNNAIVQAVECAYATAAPESKINKEKGFLESNSGSVYYLEKENGQWFVKSDSILYENTFLGYGSAKLADVKLLAPAQLYSNTEYTASLKMTPPKDSVVIASIGQEKITYPQETSEEIFRKLPDDGILERVFTSNKDNTNEFAVSSFGITEARIVQNHNLKIYITGLGFLTTRVNVIPKNKYVKINDKGQNDKQENSITKNK